MVGERIVAWSVPEKIQLRMMHSLEHRDEFGQMRGTYRETTAVVRRPEHGEVRVALTCGHCGRDGIFVIQDFETTRNLRRVPILRSLIIAAVLIAIVVTLWVIGLALDSALFLILAGVATLILLPFGIVLALEPTGKIGVQPPETVRHNVKPVREGIMTYVSRNPDSTKGLSCSGFAHAAK